MKIIHIPPDEKITTYIRKHRQRRPWYRSIPVGNWMIIGAAVGVIVTLILIRIL